MSSVGVESHFSSPDSDWPSYIISETTQEKCDFIWEFEDFCMDRVGKERELSERIRVGLLEQYCELENFVETLNDTVQGLMATRKIADVGCSLELENPLFVVPKLSPPPPLPEFDDACPPASAEIVPNGYVSRSELRKIPKMILGVKEDMVAWDTKTDCEFKATREQVLFKLKSRDTVLHDIGSKMSQNLLALTEMKAFLSRTQHALLETELAAKSSNPRFDSD